MMQNKLSFLFVLSLFSNTAFAAHPLVTEDTGMQGLDKQQIELNMDHVDFAGRRTQVSGLTYTYGLRDSIDLYANLPLTWTQPSGINDVALGTKILFLEKEELKLAFKAEWQLPTGNPKKGLGSDSQDANLLLVGSYDLSDWTVQSNIALTAHRFRDTISHKESRSVVWRASTAVLYTIRPEWKVLADISIAQNELLSRRNAEVTRVIGIIASPTPDIDVDIGVQFVQHNSGLEKRWGAGLSLRY